MVDINSSIFSLKKIWREMGKRSTDWFTNWNLCLKSPDGRTTELSADLQILRDKSSIDVMYIISPYMTTTVKASVMLDNTFKSLSLIQMAILPLLTPMAY